MSVFSNRLNKMSLAYTSPYGMLCVLFHSTFKTNMKCSYIEFLLLLSIPKPSKHLVVYFRISIGIWFLMAFHLSFLGHGKCYLYIIWEQNVAYLHAHFFFLHRFLFSCHLSISLSHMYECVYFFPVCIFRITKKSLLKVNLKAICY